MASKASGDPQQVRTVQMTTGQYAFHKISQFLVGGSVRLIALQQAMHAGVRISEVALRHIEFAKAMTFGTRPITLPNDGQVPEMLVDLGNRVLAHFNYRTFANESSMKLLKDAMPFAVTSIVAWEVGAYFFGKPSPLYNVVSVLPINLRFQSLQEMVGAHGNLKKAATAWVDRALGRGDYENGCSSADELKKELVRKLGDDKAQEVNAAIDTAEKARIEAKPAVNSKTDAGKGLTAGQVISSRAFNFLFGGSLRLVALQQTLQAALRISEVALRGVDAGKHVLFGERAVTIAANSGLPTLVRDTANSMLKQYSFRSFTEMGAAQLLKETAPFALTAVVLWEMANFLFGAPSPAYNIVSVLPVNVRKDTLGDMISRHKGIIPAGKALFERTLGRGDFANNTRSVPEIKQDLESKYGKEAAAPILGALDKAIPAKTK
ncbi:MAG: hypothetical protein HKM07_02630 [Chlamydiae bacterium]|nr:hypothetical protein [Chlamydiota bacterium]